MVKVGPPNSKVLNLSVVPLLTNTTLSPELSDSFRYLERFVAAALTYALVRKNMPNVAATIIKPKARMLTLEGVLLTFF